MYIFAQTLGVVVSVISIVAIQMRKKWQILLLSMVANFLSMVTFLILNGFGSAVTVNVIAVVQCAINAYISYKGKEASVIQKIIFISLFFVSGVFGYNVLLDIMPIAASLVFTWSAFQKKEQHIRLFLLFNVLIWITYDLIIGTTAVIGQILSLISIIIGLYRYKKSDNKKQNNT